MTTADPISLAQAQRLAANADTILLRATRPADLETPIGAFLRLDDGGPGLPARIGRGRRAARALLVPGRRAAPPARGPRRRRPDPDPAGDGARLRPGPADRDDRRRRSAGRHPGVRAAPPRPADRGHAALHRRRRRRARLRRGLGLRADACRCPSATRSASRLAAFIETDLVLVFDHLTHTLSAIASLHTETPDLEARYRIAEAAIFEALERTSRPTAAELAGTPRAGRDGAPRRGRSRRARSTGRDQPRPRRVHPRGRGRQGRHRGRRGDPGRPRPAPVVRPADRPGDRRAARRDRPVPRAPPGQPEPVPVLRPDARLRGRRRVARSCCSRSRATG